MSIFNKNWSLQTFFASILVLKHIARKYNSSQLLRILDVSIYFELHPGFELIIVFWVPEAEGSQWGCSRSCVWVPTQVQPDLPPMCWHVGGRDVWAGLMLSPPSQDSEEGTRGGCCQQPICTPCLPANQACEPSASFLSETSGEPFSQEGRGVPHV
jgi:hypothetical protein